MRISQTLGQKPWINPVHLSTHGEIATTRTLMGVSASIISTVTGQQIQKHMFGRIPFVGTAFHLESGERVTAQRVEVGKPAPGKFATPVNVWVTPEG